MLKSFEKAMDKFFNDNKFKIIERKVGYVKYFHSFGWTMEYTYNEDLTKLLNENEQEFHVFDRIRHNKNEPLHSLCVEYQNGRIWCHLYPDKINFEKHLVDKSTECEKKANKIVRNLINHVTNLSSYRLKYVTGGLKIKIK